MATTERPLSRQRWLRLLVGVLLGAVTGVLLVLVAQFLVRGEPQLLVGVAGMWLAAAGAVAGFILALRRTLPRTRGTDPRPRHAGRQRGDTVVHAQEARRRKEDR